ncbi:outer membrane beta-barrel protein [uncultured Alsobacter sp.]|uniref:outer membrane beta-barrel protein n=1 Tax=uncultured Alsobacter sp. TaxID=1748258 RepID=UPI0025D184B7|nr:outer membrane beta-barrel protein [uncultured Alsobacter sp.]
MTADRRFFLARTAGLRAGLAVACCVLALACAAPARAQEQTSLIRPSLEPSPAPVAKPAFRGTYKRVGKPVRSGKSTVQKPARGVAAVRLPGDAPLAPPVGTAPPAAKPAPALPEVTATVRRKPVREIDPFAPTGVQVGAFVLKPSLDSSAGYTTNPDQIAGTRKGSWTVREEGAVQVDSTWSRHAFSANLRGGYSDFLDAPGASRPDAEGLARLRLDVSRDTVVDLTTNGRLSTQQAGIEQPIVGSKRALILDYGAAAGVTETFGRLSFGLKGGIARTEYGSLALAGGTSLDQSDRNVTAFEGRLRVGYALSPAIQPFAETTLDHRVRDTALDSAGFRRNSVGTAVRTGAVLAFSELLTGEISAGYGWRNYDDPRLATVGAALLDASLIWSPTALTTVTLRAGSEIAETSLTTSAGAVVHKAGFEVAHALRRNLTITGAIEASRTDYQGAAVTEDRLAAALKLDWKLNRTVVVRASAAHERLQSSIPGNDYTANVYLLGLRLQR